jgi:hypothetical protein
MGAILGFVTAGYVIYFMRRPQRIGRLLWFMAPIFCLTLIKANGLFFALSAAGLIVSDCLVQWGVNNYLSKRKQNLFFSGVSLEWRKRVLLLGLLFITPLLAKTTWNSYYAIANLNEPSYKKLEKTKFSVKKFLINLRSAKIYKSKYKVFMTSMAVDKKYKYVRTTPNILFFKKINRLFGGHYYDYMTPLCFIIIYLFWMIWVIICHDCWSWMLRSGIFLFETLLCIIVYSITVIYLINLFLISNINIMPRYFYPICLGSIVILLAFSAINIRRSSGLKDFIMLLLILGGLFLWAPGLESIKPIKSNMSKVVAMFKDDKISMPKLRSGNVLLLSGNTLTQVLGYEQMLKNNFQNEWNIHRFKYRLTKSIVDFDYILVYAKIRGWEKTIKKYSKLENFALPETYPALYRVDWDKKTDKCSLVLIQHEYN